MTTLGTVTTEFGNGAIGSDVTILTDGKILVAGDTNNVGATDSNFALVRYNANGTLDTSFDGDGKLSTDFGGNDWGSRIYLQSDGKFLVAGSALNSSEHVSMIGVARYNADGSLDASFSGDGKVITGVPNSAQGFGMTVQPDGKILVTGNGSDACVLIRYNSDGSLDTSFDSDGKVSTVFDKWNNGNSVVVQPDGKILMVGLTIDEVSYQSRVAVARYNTDGTLDTNFDSDGKVAFNFNGGHSAGFDLKVLADGKILISGAAYNSSTGGSDIGLARLNANGSLDSSFGVGGLITTKMGTDQPGGYIALQADGKILVAGGLGNFSLLRYNLDGSLDTQFSEDGIAQANFGGAYESATGIAIQADGKIVVVGSTDIDTNPMNGGGKFAVARFNIDGSLDSTFSSSATQNQAWTGTSQNESFSGGTGNDAIDGAGGTDTAVYTGKISDYFISYNRALGTATITDHRANADGIDTLKSIEKLQFSDKTFDLINLPVSGTPGYGKIESFLFDAAYYLLKNPDLVPTVTLATAYYNYKSVGAVAGDAPNAWFDAAYYANKWADLTSLNLDAATLFQHYNLFGVWEGRSGGPAFDNFDGTRYLSENIDVAAYVDTYVADFLGSRSNGAIAHYVIYGANEGRAAFDSDGQQISQAILIGTSVGSDGSAGER